MSGNIYLCDLGALTYQRPEPGRVVVSAPGVPELLIATVPAAASDREAVFLSLDQVLGQGKVPTLHGLVPVGLYNPLSGEVAVGSLPVTLAFTDGEPLPIPEDGVFATLDGGTLVVGDRVLSPRSDTWTAVHEAVAAHQ